MIKTGANGDLKENSFHRREIIHVSEEPYAVLSKLSSLQHRLQGRSVRADLKKKLRTSKSNNNNINREIKKQTNKEDEHELKTCATSVLTFFQIIFENDRQCFLCFSLYCTRKP